MSYSLGTLFKTKCLTCGDVAKNNDSPICESLRNKGYILYILNKFCSLIKLV